jgi:hypothetical protein
MNIIGFRGLQSFVTMNESLNMSFLFLKKKLDIACKCFVKCFLFQASSFRYHPNLTKLFLVIDNKIKGPCVQERKNKNAKD